MLVTGQQLFDNATKLLAKPDVSFQELEKVFHDLNVLADSSYIDEEDHQSLSALWFHLGSVCIKRNHKLLGLVCFREALACKPEFLEALNNIAYVFKKMNFSNDATEYFKKIIDLIESGKVETTDENKSEFYTNYGSMFVAKGTPEKAIELFNKAIKYNSKNKLAYYNLGLAQLETGDYANGWKGYNLGERTDQVVNRNYGHENLPMWDGTKGKNIVIIGEQGIGDELMWGTIIDDVIKDNNVVLDMHPRLADMFRRSFPMLDVYGTRKDSHYHWGKRYKLDAKILIGSLPEFYRKKEEDFTKLPYLKVDSKLSEMYELKLDSLSERPKIGISWRGGTKNTGRNSRYIPMEQLLPILKLDCDFISLQYDKDIKKEVEDFATLHKVRLHHWQDMLDNYEHTAACVDNLDLVISVPQSVVHLAGAIGNPLTWQLCPIQTLWQGGVYGHDMPWYSNVVNIWQEKDGNWDSVINKVKGDLCSLLQMNTEN